MVGCVIIFSTVEATAQTTVTSNSGSGNWSNTSTWIGGVVPQNSGSNTYNAIIAGSSIVNLNVSRTVNQLNVNSGGTLNFSNGQFLAIVNNGQSGAGVINNNGSINISSTGNQTFLQFPVTGNSEFRISGSGVLTLSGTSNVARIIGTSARLTHSSGHTIQGSGSVGNNSLGIVNQGTIRARNGDSLLIDPPNVAVNGTFFANDGLVQAQSGGTVTLVGNGGEFAGSGEYRAESGGTLAMSQNVVMRNTRITGAGQVTLESGNHTWQSVNHSSNSVVQNGSALNLSTRLTNSGNIQLASGASTTAINVNGDTTLDGGGSIRMTGNNARISGNGVGTLFNDNHTISGNGLLGVNSLKIINQGTIQAGAGEVMTIDPRVDAGNPNLVTFNNRGLVRAYDGGRIVFNGAAGAIGGTGTFRAEANSIMEFTTGSRVLGGIFEKQGNGQILISGSTNIGNITNNSDLTVTNGATQSISGPVINNGSINVASTGAATTVSVQGTQTVSGTGSIALTGPNSSITGTGSFTNGAGHTITGGGSIGSNTLAINNAGTITNAPGSSMTVGGAFQNSGTVAIEQIATPNLPSWSFVGPSVSNTKTGTISNAVGSSATVAGSFQNAGTVIVRPTSTSTPSMSFNSFAQTSGNLRLEQARASMAFGAAMSGGFLSGTGTVAANNFQFGGTSSLRPGFSPGQLNFEGDLTWEDGGVIEFDLGATPIESDFIDVLGDLWKADEGEFAFDFKNNGWLAGQTYDLLQFESTNFSIEDFSFANGGGFAGEFAFSGGNRLQFTLTTVPEPGSASLVIAFGSLMLLHRRRATGKR